MLKDMVLDTNVFVHADMPKERRRKDSRTLLKKLLAGTMCLRVDSGFSMNESKNKSLIGHEYIKHVRFPMLGYQVLVSLGNAGRIRTATTKITEAERKARDRLGLAKPGDRRMITIAIKSESGILVSHDEADFTKARRKTIKREFSVEVIDAGACCPLL